MSELSAQTEAFCSNTAHSPSLRRLAAQGDVRRYRKGTILIHESDRGDTLFIVMEGRVKVFSTDASGREITLGVIVAGDYFGEMALDGGARSASVITLESAVCALVTRATLLAFIGQEPGFALDLLGKVIRRARSATNAVRNLAFTDVYGRITQLLVEMAEPQPDGTALVRERMTQQDIASRVGCSREMVSRIMKDLEAGGYVGTQNRHIVLLAKLPARW
ncbi:MAG TPA: cyclic nucleotide-binding domain-containing protein [Pseudorhodoferax sp.]|jgi:CRP/FNR family cyclic AMP-dependent transcriptional regulator|nr:cyclic nucleotide-binding domain-containing protein [Pseudorhodoferax sp.]